MESRLLAPSSSALPSLLFILLCLTPKIFEPPHILAPTSLPLSLSREVNQLQVTPVPRSGKEPGMAHQGLFTGSVSMALAQKAIVSLGL